MELKRSIFYIDGFNLYFGLKSKGWRRYYWLNLQEMCQRLLKEDQKLVKVRYFTARITNAPEDKRKRQLTYLEALETLPLVEIHYGTYLSSKQQCLKCGNIFYKYSEKKSDVNIAVKLLTDAIDNIYDLAFLISADSDLVPTVEAVKRYFPDKKVLLFFPPKRKSAALKDACNIFCGVLNKTTLSKSQLPEEVKSKTGFILKRPKHWS